MLGLIICDDDRFMLGISVDLAKRCIKENRFDAAVLCATTDFREALRFIEKNPGAYLHFLDIDLGKTSLNGVDVARVIRRAEPASKIVFVTGHADMGISVLKSGVEAFGFIEKTTNEEKMLSAYKKYINLALTNTATTDEDRPREGYIQLSVDIDEHVTLPVSQILYVEADKSVSHFICYHTVDGSSVSVRDTIENALNSLGESFMKSHRSVVINTNLVVSVADGLVKFADGETAACSFRLKNEVMKKCGVKKRDNR